MVSDRALGAALLAGGAIAIIIYVWALFFAGPFAWWIAISVVALIAVAAVCVIIAWVGYTLLTTPAPSPPSLEETSPEETPSETPAEGERKAEEEGEKKD